MAHIISLAYKPADEEPHPAGRFARAPMEHVVLIAGHGIAGDAKGSKGHRQLNVLLAEAVELLKAEGCHTAPGELGEQMVVSGLSRDALGAGTRLQLGESAVIEFTRDREPCSRLVGIQGRTMDVFVGRVGFMARVLVGGEVAVGAGVVVLKGFEESGLPTG